MDYSGRTKCIMVILVLILAVVSYTWLGEVCSKPETYAGTIETLDEKSENVLTMAASTAAIATGLSMVPGDTTDPVANEMADLSSTMMLVLSVIFLEKYMLTLAGVVSFKVLVPIACLMAIIYIFTRREMFKVIVSKLLIMALAFVMLVPVSTAAINFVDETYDVSLTQNIEDAENMADDFNSNANKDEGGITKWINKAKNGVKGILEDVQTLFKNLVEMTALMIVTSCIMPILTMAMLLWLLNMVLGINIPTDKIKQFAKSGSKVREKLTKAKKEQMDEA